MNQIQFSMLQEPGVSYLDTFDRYRHSIKDENLNDIKTKLSSFTKVQTCSTFVRVHNKYTTKLELSKSHRGVFKSSKYEVLTLNCLQNLPLSLK